MIQEPRIIPECFGDTVWVTFIYERTVLHGLGSDVANAMKKFPNRLTIGIIDDDKTKPTYFNEFTEVIKKSDRIELRRKPNSNHHIIVISPAIEKWLLRMAEKGEIKHPYTFETLKKAMKSEKVDSNQELKKFLNTLKQKKIPAVNDFKNWLLELIPH